MKNVKINFSDREYRREHFRCPKGTGSWGFALNPDNVEDFRFFYGTLTKAKQEAARYYKETAMADGALTVYILP